LKAAQAIFNENYLPMEKLPIKKKRKITEKRRIFPVKRHNLNKKMQRKKKETHNK